MPDKKLTDNEKTKALECCIEGDCDNCPYDEQTACNEYMKQDCLDLINRQKAENERLERHTKMHDEIKAEAYKEFAERLKEEIDIRPTYSNEQNKYVFFLIDNLLKEMVGEGNGR